MKKPPFLSKTCSSCGIEKSAAAFLIASPEGEHYSNICAKCRTKSTLNEKDRTTRTGSGAIIDSKSKVHSDITKQEEKQQTEEEYYKERDEKEHELKEEHSSKSESSEKEKLRIEKNKQASFLNDKPRQVKQDKTKQQSRWALQENTNKERHNVDELIQSEENQAEAQKTQTNFAAPFEDTRVAGKLKFSGESFQRFASWVGQGSPISKTLSQNKAPNNTEKPSEFTERKWGPGSKKP